MKFRSQAGLAAARDRSTALMAPAPKPPLPVPAIGAGGALTRLARSIALLVTGWLVLRRRFSLEVNGTLQLAAVPREDEGSPRPLIRADIVLGTGAQQPSGLRLSRPARSQVNGRSFNVLGDLPRALRTGEVVLHYQPIVALGDRRIRGAEGLVRWEHPRHGLLPPAAFIQVVEQTGLIGPLTRHVLDRAIAQCARWRDDGEELTVAVNLSVRNLLDHELPADVADMLERHSLPAAALQLEITESSIMSDPDGALGTVTRLSDLGVHMSVDDFGTGYSSLANLRRLPIDELKIDRSFVTPMLEDESDLIIVRSTINMAHDLGLRIVAEGVEDQPTLVRLTDLGADLAQGYHLSKPLPAGEFDDWRSRVLPPL